MTNAIEQAKREMYDLAREMRSDPYHDCHKDLYYRLSAKKYGEFENALESYLEKVRQDHEALHVTARARFESIHGLEQANQDLQRRNDNQCERIVNLQSRLDLMTEERDSIQLRLHAVDHAYNEAEKKLGQCETNLRHWREEVGKLDSQNRVYASGEKIQRMERDLRETREDVKNAEEYSQKLYLETIRLKESVEALKTPRHTLGQDSPCRASCAKPDASTMALLVAVVDCRQVVTDCYVYGYRAKKQMKKLAYVLNNNPELRAAMIHFEGLDKS